MKYQHKQQQQQTVQMKELHLQKIADRTKGKGTTATATRSAQTATQKDDPTTGPQTHIATRTTAWTQDSTKTRESTYQQQQGKCDQRNEEKT